MNWNDFLQDKPAITLARESLSDEEFLTYLQKLFRSRTPDHFRNTITYHAFEETGWPEGAIYCHQHSAEYSLLMHQPKNIIQQISPRLVLRQAHWKSNKEEHMEAHQILLSLLPEKAQNQHLLGELAAA